MIVDDRLETVLRTVAAGPSAIRTQFRQLVDLLSRTPAEDWTETHAEALGRIDSIETALGDNVTGALIRSCTLRSPILVEHFAEAGPKVALAAIMSARLRDAEWLQIIPELPVQARGFLRHRRDLGPVVEGLLRQRGVTDFALPLPANFEPMVLDAPAEIAPNAAPQPLLPTRDAPVLVAVPTPAPAPPSSSAQGEGISAIIQRIEAFRRSREGEARHDSPSIEPSTAPGQSRLPFVDEPQPIPRQITALDLQVSADGTIVGADAAHAAALVGLRPFAADPDAPASCDAASSRAARARLPIEAGLFAIEGAAAIAGTWRIDAVPLFGPDTGHFLGYHARLRRPLAAAATAAANDDEYAGNADRLRQMLHELRTPINAIQGFSELIQQQMLGPTPHQYRSLAAGIASDAARMLAGFEDIERLVGLESGALDQAEGMSDLTGLLIRLISQLDPVLAPREVKLRCDLPDGPLMVAVEPAELERTLWRLLSLMAGSAAPGERLALSARVGKNDMAHLTVPLPAALAMRDDAALMPPDGATALAGGGAAMLGGGFALRLAAAEIRAAGGQLGRSGARLDITLPLLTRAQRTLSQGAGAAGQAV